VWLGQVQGEEVNAVITESNLVPVGVYFTNGQRMVETGEGQAVADADGCAASADDSGGGTGDQPAVTGAQRGVGSEQGGSAVTRALQEDGGFCLDGEIALITDAVQ